MALIAALLDLEKEFALEKFGPGFRAPDYPVHVQAPEYGLECPNPNCITNDAHDGPSASRKFYLVRKDELRLRCYYCESDIAHALVGYRKSRHYDADAGASSLVAQRPLEDLVFFPNAAAAERHGFRAYRRSRASGA